MQFNLKSLLAASLVTGALFMGGCSGDDGAKGADGKDLTGQVQVSSLTTEQWADLKPQVDPASVSVSIASPPVVKFKVTDASGNPVVGLGTTSKSSTATVPSYSNISFALAKLVPGTSGSPSKWVSYIVTTVPTTTTPVTGSRPTTDNTGTLVDNGDGTYQYTFYRDVTKVKDVVAGLTLTAPNSAADLGDLTYNPNLTHRLTIQISGNAPGTGTNTATAVQTIAGVPMKNPANIIYDFIPATGKAVSATDAKRDIAMNAACLDCHTKFTFHGGARQDVRYCVVCHTDQRKYGRTEATIAGSNFTSTTYRVNDASMGDMPTMVHKIHMGEHLSKTNYDYAGVKFNHVTYSQPVKNCTKCHAQSASTPQGDNWKTLPSRLACGACHDNVDFAVGTNHVGGRATTDANCVLCHDADSVNSYHYTIDPEGSEGRGGFPVNTALDTPTVGFASGQGPAIPLASVKNLPSDIFKFAFEIKSVTVAGASGAKKATIEYRILKNGAPVTFTAAGGTTLMADVDGTPSLYISYAIPNYQNVAAPTDWTTGFNASVLNVRNGASGHTQTGPDADGYYKATLSNVVPDNATMVTGALGINYQGFRQTNLSRYPNGIRLREPAFAIKTATSYTARRSIVDNAKCNKCHEQLGVMPSFHSGARNNGVGCALASCHQPNKPTGHIGAANGYGGGWSVSSKDMIHGIHGSAKRANDFSYEATADNPAGFGVVTYPNLAQNCEACHVPGSYDFRNANSTTLAGLIWSVAAAGDMTNPDPVANPSIGLSPWIDILAGGQIDYSAANNNLMISPVTASCFGCHDDTTAVAHMQGNGGVIYQPRGTYLNNSLLRNPEQCLICHGPDKTADIRKVHNNF